MTDPKATEPARVLDKLRGVIIELVGSGLVKPFHGDKEVYILVGAYLKAHGWSVPSERSFRRHINRLRPLWRVREKRVA